MLQWILSFSHWVMSDTFVKPWTAAHQAPLSMEFPRQEHWSGLPFAFSRGCSWPRDQTCDSCIGRLILYHWPLQGSPAINTGVHIFSYIYISSVQFSPVAQSCLTFWSPIHCSMPGFPVHHQLMELTQTHVHLILYHPLLLPPSIFLSIRVFSFESVLPTMWSNYWSFSFSISPSN